jgi:hypothetical protein
MFPNDLSEVLRAAIIESERSQNELAGSAGVSQPVVSDFLSRKSDLYLATASKLVAALGQFWPRQFFPTRKNNQCSVGVVMAPAICGERFCHLDWAAANAWVWSDFITGKRVECAPAPNPSYARRSLNEMLAEIVLWGPVPYWDKRDAETWKKYLELLTTGFTGKRSADRKKANSAFGEWRAIKP